MSKIKSILACAALCVAATFASSLFAECPGGYCSRPGMYAGNRTGWGSNPSYHTQSGAYATDLYGSGHAYSTDYEFTSGYPHSYTGTGTPYSYSSNPSYGSNYGGYSYSSNPNASSGLYQQNYNYQYQGYSNSPYSGSGTYDQNNRYQNYQGQNFYRSNDGRGQPRSR